MTIARVICAAVMLILPRFVCALDDAATCKEIRDFVEANPSKFDTFKEIEAYKDSPSVQRVAFGLLSNGEKREFLLQFLANIIATEELSESQREVLLKLVEILDTTPPSLALTKVQELEEEAAKEFTNNMLTLNPFAASEVSSREGFEDYKPSDVSKEGAFECNCNPDSWFNGCAGEDNDMIHAWHCHKNDQLCTSTERGCGFLALYPCVGECFGRYQDGGRKPYWVPTRKGRNDPVHYEPKQPWKF